MTPATLMRNRYVNDSVGTASPSRLLCMLYDRLVLDLVNAEESLASGRPDVANTKLQHAQEIVIELRASLDVEAWEGGPGLARLYSFFLTELISANVHRDAAKVATVRGLIEPLRDTWYEAAALNAASAG